jgi:L-alanine-DL-glutamate epimerase-like enolase superfamily enzyme
MDPRLQGITSLDVVAKDKNLDGRSRLRHRPGDMPESLWSRVADLALTIAEQRWETVMAPGEPEHGRYVLHLGDGTSEGLGEEVGGTMMDEDGAFLSLAPSLPLAGAWTLASFSDHVAGLDLWPAPPEWDMARRLRRWAFESAALDLALAQNGRSLAEAVGRAPAPVRFVNSLGLGDPPSFAMLDGRLQRYPALRFKLDAQPSWSASLIAQVAATGAVDVVDFKGRYGIEVEDEAALLAMYREVVARFPDAILEDPHDLPEVAELLAPHAARVSFDAPIATAADVTTTIVNVKPSRIGSVRALLDICDHCEQNGVRMYGGGMGEQAVARGQIELLASLFHPHGTNDVAPPPYNLADPPAGLPQSPLLPGAPAPGFRWS